MKRIFLTLLISSLLMLACNGGKGYKELTADQVVGLPPFTLHYGIWAMAIPEEKTEKIIRLMEGTTVEVYFCENKDSVQFVSYFIMIIRLINYDQSKVKFFMADCELVKGAPIEKAIFSYPTFIFSKKNKEIGRISGTLRLTFEDNIIELLSRNAS